MSCVTGAEWVPHDDDSERQAPLHLRQRRRVPGPLHGEFFSLYSTYTE